MARKKYIDFEAKKNVHFNMTSEAHSELRIKLFKRRLSVTEVFQELANMIVEGSPQLERVLDRLEVSKREKIIKKLSAQDAESLFKVIESENPLSDN